MNRFVLDNSVVMAWVFDDESGPYAHRVLDSFAKGSAVVPALWPVELANALIVAERRKRLAPGHSLRFLAMLRDLPIEVVADADMAAAERLLSLAREFNLSAYDAAYLSLAMSNGLPLATQDDALRQAARPAKVALWLA